MNMKYINYYIINNKKINIPKCFYFGLNKEKTLNWLIVEQFGDSLEYVFNAYYRYFSMEIIKFISHKLLNNIKLIHKYDIIHGDIKPSNFVFRRKFGEIDKSNDIYTIDFGISTKIGTIDKSEEPLEFCGTYRYASIDTHNGKIPCKRDDLWSFFYVIIYFLFGELPWMNIEVN